MSIDEGRTIAGRYEVLRIHPGGMGVVYIVRDLESGEILAAKSIREDLRNDVQVRRRFEREISTWIGLGPHPNVVAARFVEEDDGAPFLFLEYVEGPTLAALLAAERPLNLALALDLAGQFARGMLFAHEGEGSGLIHRDLKPANLFVRCDRVGKVSDFGIAKVRAADLDATAEGIGMGTPLYIPPEQLKGSTRLDGRADVYSFGAVLFEMITGDVPLRAESLESQIYLVLRQVPVAPSVLNSRVPPALDDLVRRCLAKSPEDRPSGFRPILDELGELAVSPEIESADPPRSTCPDCGFASTLGPGPCPLCGATTGPGRAYSPLLLVPRDPGQEEARPARLSISRSALEPHMARVGERVTVRVSVVNRGTVAARQVELAYAVPDQDVFQILSPDEAWRGEVPPTGMGRPFDITYSFIPLREGSYDLAAPSLRYQAGEGRAEIVVAPQGGRLSVSLNLKLPLVGREREWDLLTRHLAGEEAAIGLVTSEGGGGRSRFVDEIGDWLTGNERLVLKGKALERGGQPLKVFHDIARRIFAVDAAPLDTRGMMARVIDRLAPLVGEDAALAGFFSSFLSGSVVPESQARMRGYLWFRLLSALAREKPVVLLLTDLQWGDGESIDLMEGLIRRAHEDGVALSMVVSSLTSHREERVRRRIAAIGERMASLSTEPGLALRVDLSPLTRDSVQRLLEHLFPGNTLGEDHPWLVPVLTRQSGGNSFHLMQILRLLRQARDDVGEPLVSAEGGRWTLRPELTEDKVREMIPPATDGMVRNLVSSLPEEVREVLARAAVIGGEFSYSLLRETVEDEVSLERGLEVLERADLVRVRGEGGDRYRFTNSIVPAIVLKVVGEQSHRALVRLHRDVARAMEKTLTDRELLTVALSYARHLRFAGERNEAFRWSVIAAEQYAGAQLFLRARRALEDADRLLFDGVEAPEGFHGKYHYLRGEVARVTGDLSGALVSYGEAIDHLARDADRGLMAAALSRMGRIHEIRADADRAVSSYQLAAEVRQEIGEPGDLAHSENDLGAIHLLRGEDERATERFTRALELARETGNRSALAMSLDKLAALANKRSDWESAEALYRESFDLGEKGSDRLGMAHSLNGLGGTAFRRGDLGDAARLYHRALDLRREVGDREGVASIFSNLGVIHDRWGEYEEALRYYRRAVDAHRAIGSRVGLATALNNIGVVNLRRGDVGIALEHFTQALRIRREIGDRARIGSSLTNLAEGLGLSGRLAEADQGYREAHDLCLAADDPSGVAGALMGRARIYRRRGDLQEAEEVLALAFRSEGRDQVVRAALHLEAAEQHFVRGETDAARIAAERGLDLATEIGDLEARAQATRILAGGAAGNDPAEALSLLARAEEFLAGTSGPELARVLLEQGMLLADHDRRRARDVLMRSRGLLDAMEARGAVLPERACVERLLMETSGEAGS